MQNEHDSLQPSCTLTNARRRSRISVIGTSRNFRASAMGATATRAGSPSPTCASSSATRPRSAAPSTSETPGRPESSSGARWA